MSATLPLKAAGFSVIFGHTVAFLDETIQIFSGRGPEIRDVWIDTFGFISISLMTYAAFYFIARLVKKEK